MTGGSARLYAVRRKRCGCLVSSRPAEAGEAFTTRHPDDGTTTVMPLDQAAVVAEFCDEHQVPRDDDAGQLPLTTGGADATGGGAEAPLHAQACATGSIGEPMMQFFAYAHLPEALQAISRPFGMLAEQMVANLPRNAERTVALRKLLEAKDCAVRAAIYREGDFHGGIESS